MTGVWVGMARAMAGGGEGSGGGVRPMAWFQAWAERADAIIEVISVIAFYGAWGTGKW